MYFIMYTFCLPLKLLLLISWKWAHTEPLSGRDRIKTGKRSFAGSAVEKSAPLMQPLNFKQLKDVEAGYQKGHFDELVNKVGVDEGWHGK